MSATRIRGWFWGAVVGAAAVLGTQVPAGAADFIFPQSGSCTSNYYSQRSYGNHGALDIAGPNRSAVTAARAGRVTFYGVNGGYGNLMIVTHEAGYTTYYAHLTSAAVGVGTSVNAGQTIAYEGSTGNSTGPHVHFEVRRYGTKQYVPGSVGAYFTRGNGIGHDYPGIGDTSQAPGGSNPPPSNGGSTSGDHGAWRVTTSALNVRTGPSTSNASIGLVYSGQVYVSDASNNGWRRVWFGGRQGWSSQSYLSRSTGVTVHIVNTDALNVRTGAGTGNSIVATIGRGQRYARAGGSGDWAQIFFDGASRWLHAGYTRTETYR